MMSAADLTMTALRALVLYGALLFVVRILGKRTVGNITAFDLIVALILGEVVDEAIFGDVPVVKALGVFASVGGLHYLNSYLSFRSGRIDRFLGGNPRVLVRNGELDHRALAHERINEEELWSLLRLQKVEALEEVKRATLEPDGLLSVIRTEEAREVERRDLVDLYDRLASKRDQP